ncbi:MAG: hypothetical protein CL666_14590 [Balneola sp.]|nr:hypothetical protein [Balneola sp.]|tara:strand:+ start:57464 stop:57823 length:360 start_codon:yes stop_codon:yes gene_type:complete
MIHDRHNNLTDRDRTELEAKDSDQVSQIKDLLIERGEPMAFFEVMDELGFHQDSTKRALSELTKETDQHGRPFAIYDKDDRKNNPYGRTCGTYRHNPKYGRPKAQTGEQISFLKQRCAV